MTNKVLEELKAKLLSGRDKFLLSDKDNVPSFGTKKKSVDEQERLIK